MSENLIKRLRTVARDEERAWGDEDEVVILLREAADALESSPAPVQVPEGAVWSIIRKAMRHGAGLSNSCATTADFNAALDAHAAEYERQVTAMLTAAPVQVSLASQSVPEGFTAAVLEDAWCHAVPLTRPHFDRFMAVCREMAAAPSVPVPWEETALEQFKKFASTEPMTALERLRFFLSCALKPQDWLDVEQFLDALPSAPAAPSVDAEKVMALVEEYGDLMCSVGMNSGQPWARGRAAECRKEADTSLAQIRALLSAPPAASGWQPIETAPKDGTRILLAKIGATNAVPGLGIKAREPHVWWACTGHWSEKWKNWNDGIEPCGLAGPNYWQPLPPPPAIANQEAQE